MTDATIGEIRDKLAAMDREAAVNIMVNKLGLSKQQAQDVAQSAIGVVDSIKGAGKELKDKSLDLGNATMTGVGSAAWWLFVLAVLSLGASLIGGAIGIGRELLTRVEDAAYPLDVKPAMTT